MNPVRFSLAVLLGVTAGVFISSYWLIDVVPAGSRSLILATALLSVASAAVYYALLGVLGTGVADLQPRRMAQLVLWSLLLGFFLFFTGTSHWQGSGRYATFLLPRHEFRLVTEGAPSGTAVTWINTRLGDVSYEEVQLKGWKRQGDRLVLEDPIQNSIAWSTMTGDHLQLVLETERPGGSVRLWWDGVEDTAPLDGRRTTLIEHLPVPLLASAGFIDALGILQFALLALCLLLVGTGRWDILLSGKMPDLEASTAGVRLFDVAAVAAAMVLAAMLRGFNLGTLFPAVDEYYHLIAADQLNHGAALGEVYPRGLWLVTMPISLAFRVFGHEVWAARLPGVLANVLAIVPLYLLTRKMSRHIAVIAVILFATSPWIIAFSRVAREYAYYPFIFYLIALAMAALIEAIPGGFVAARDWRLLPSAKVATLTALLILPPIFALKIDWLSTFRTILIAYLVFGAALLARFDWKATTNRAILGIGTGIVLGGAFAGFREQLTKLSLVPTVNPVPLAYFFPNPPQQWYFDRIGIIAALAVVAAIVGSLRLRSLGILPIFFAGLWISYLGVFTLFSRSFFHTRHLLSTQFWFVIVAAVGLSWIWNTANGFVNAKGKVWGAVLGLALVACVLNPSQIALPMMSTSPDMPISEDYHHDMGAVQEYMLAHVRTGDALVATVYGFYATWQAKPAFGEQFRITSRTTRKELQDLVSQHDTGWLVIDEIRLQLSTVSPRDIASLPQMRYIGVFGDEHVWRWGRSEAQTAAE